MVYKLDMAAKFLDEKDVDRYKKLGFNFDNCQKRYYKIGRYCIEPNDDLTIEINTIDELQKFIEEYGTVIVDNESITIYNDWIE